MEAIIVLGITAMMIFLPVGVKLLVEDEANK